MRDTPLQLNSITVELLALQAQRKSSRSQGAKPWTGFAMGHSFSKMTAERGTVIERFRTGSSDDKCW
jgi:hypothetical protein